MSLRLGAKVTLTTSKLPIGSLFDRECMGNEKELKTFHFILSEGGIVHCSRSKRVQHKGSFCPHIDFRPRKIRFIEFDDFLVNDFVKSQRGKDGTNLAIFLGFFSKM